MEQPVLEYEGTREEIAMHEPEFRGRRLRVTVLTDNNTTVPDSTPSATELLKLPIAQRNRILAAQAALLKGEYRNNPDLIDFETFGPDDLYTAIALCISYEPQNTQ